MQFLTRIPRKTQSNLIYFHRQSMPGNSKTVHCGIRYSLTHPLIVSDTLTHLHQMIIATTLTMSSIVATTDIPTISPTVLAGITTLPLPPCVVLDILTS